MYNNIIMKKFYVILLAIMLLYPAKVFAEDFLTPVPAEEDEVSQSGPDTKYSLVTDLRFDAFQNAEINVPVDFLQSKKILKLYELSPSKTYLKRVKILNAKITEYTNGSFDVRFKDIPDVIFSYNIDGELQSFAKMTNKGKIPFISYHYDTEGTIIALEVKADRYRSYIYGLDGVLEKYRVDDKVYSANGKMILRKKHKI